MKHDDTDFTRAWNSLTTSGEMSGEPPRPFTPVGLRTDVREAGPLYHGTRADLRPGDLLTPGHASNYGSRQTANFVYLTARKEGAALAAELAAGGWPGAGVCGGAAGTHRGRPQRNRPEVSGQPDPFLQDAPAAARRPGGTGLDAAAPAGAGGHPGADAPGRARGSRPSTNRPLDTPFQTCYLYKAVRAARRSRGMP